MWWDKLVQVQHIKEKDVTWRKFNKYFENTYLTKRYDDKKMKYFFEIKLGSMSIDEYERRFLELLKYVSFIKDETIKIQRYLSGLPPSISEKIQYDDSKTLEDTIRDNQLLDNPELLRQVVKGQCIHLFNGGVVKVMICLEIVLTEVKKRELFTMFSEMKQWGTWA
jgi:hypothetical protein